MQTISEFSIWPKICLFGSVGPKNREEKELQGENGAFDSETSRFPTLREARSARKRPKFGKCQKKTGVWCLQTLKKLNFWYSKNEPKLGLQGEVRDGMWTVWKVTAKRRVWKCQNWPPTAQKLKIPITTTDTDDDFLLLLLIILIPPY